MEILAVFSFVMIVSLLLWRIGTELCEANRLKEVELKHMGVPEEEINGK